MSEQESFSIARLIAEAARVLARAGVPEARREAMSLIEYTIARDRTFLLTHPEDALAPSAVRRLRELVERRAEGEPLQYITGHQEFYGLDFEVTPDVLIPRPETELLVETALELLDETNNAPLICDVGTGSGCIPVALLYEEAQEVRAIGLDISMTALRVAARNAARHNVRERLTLIASDCLSALDPRAARFKMIVSNPPYVAEAALAGLQREVREHEPRVALTPGGDGLRIIRRLIADAPRFLEVGGHLLMEIGFDQHEAVERLVDPQAWQLLDIHKDLQGIPRIVALRKK
ncbi:MAG: release factor glutamine methyltransferase [Acidobacteriota bacterium]|jgi:release factor glutamine methyltransferase|nr:release factor glutamine methyltransferase [Acidobacteriota bacterium]